MTSQRVRDHGTYLHVSPTGDRVQGRYERADTVNPTRTTGDAPEDIGSALARLGNSVRTIESGDVTPMLPAGRIVFVGAFTAMLRRGGGLTVDVSPDVVTDDRRSQVALIEAAAATSDVVKLSQYYAAWLYPERRLSETTARLVANGARVAAITTGATGALLASRGNNVHIPSSAIRVRDTRGAGDAFSAALIDAMLDDPANESVEAEALRALGEHASMAAAFSVQRVGITLPTRSALLRFKRAAVVQRCLNASVGVYAF